MAPNFSAIALGAGYCATFYKYRSPQAVVLPYVGASAALVATCGGAAAALPAAEAASFVGSLGCAVSVAMFSGPLASIRAVLRDRSAASIPPAFTGISIVNTSLWATWGVLVLHDPFIWAPNFLGLGSACAQAGLIARFGTAPPLQAGLGAADADAERARADAEHVSRTM